MNGNPIVELTHDRLLALLQSPCEAPALDFKERVDLTKTAGWVELAKDVLGFANSGGGHIILGVEDQTRRLVGLSSETEKKLEESKIVNDQLRQWTGTHITVSVARHLIDDPVAGRIVLGMIFVPARRQKVPAQANGVYPDPYDPKKQKWAFREGDVLIRRGDETVKAMSPEELLPLRTSGKQNFRPSESAGGSLQDFENPYNFGAAATRQMFKGRNEELNILLDAIESGTHVAVYGLQRMGKTSLVDEALKDRIKERQKLKNKVLVCMVDFQQSGSEYATSRNVLQTITLAIAREISSSQLKEVENQIALSARNWQRGSNTEMLLDFSKLLERIATQSRRKIVVFLDEFSELCKAVEKNYDLLRRNPARNISLHPGEMLVDVDLMHWFSSLLRSRKIQDRIVFVLAVRPFMAEFDAQRHLQILKLTQPITLYHLDESAARALITEPLKGHIAAKEDAVAYLVGLTAGHPYLIQFFMKEIVDRVRRQRRLAILKDDVLEFENKMISEGPAYDAQFKVLDSDYSVDDVTNQNTAKLGKGVLALMAKIGGSEREGWVRIDRICAGLSLYGCSPETTYHLLDQLSRAKIVEEKEFDGMLCFRISIPLLVKRYVKQNLYLKYFRSARARGN